MKILHITTNNKFIGSAMQTFESVYPKQNTVWMLDGKGEINASKNNYLQFRFVQTLSPLFLSKLKEFDLIVLHSFNLFWYPLVAFSSKKIKFAWLGWGFDYYGYIYNNPTEMLLKETAKLNDSCRQKKGLIFRSKSISKAIIEKLLRTSALKKISSFSPVLQQDYDLVEQAGLMPSVPPFISWNYGSLEESLVKNFIGERVDGSDILVGNSASFTNNHIEVFSLLERIAEVDGIERTVIVPLSYGDTCYREKIRQQGQQQLGDKLEVLLDFMPIEQYISTIKRCGFVIMNHIRQQAVGNIIIMLYLGARIFLRENNPTYQFLKSEGAYINTIQELSNRPELLKHTLTEKQIQRNIQIIYRHWSKEVIDEKTKNLVEFHLGGSRT